MKFDHVLSDGLGSVLLMCSLAHNNNPSIYPKIMRFPRKINYLLSYALFPLNTIINLINIFSPNFSNSFLDKEKIIQGKQKSQSGKIMI